MKLAITKIGALERTALGTPKERKVEFNDGNEGAIREDGTVVLVDPDPLHPVSDREFGLKYRSYFELLEAKSPASSPCWEKKIKPDN